MALTLPSARRAAAIDFGPVEELGFFDRNCKADG